MPRITRSVPVTANDVLDGHVALDIQCLDRLYLHGDLAQRRPLVRLSAAAADEGPGLGAPDRGVHLPRAMNVFLFFPHIFGGRVASLR